MAAQGKKNPSIDAMLRKGGWIDVAQACRAILLECGLTEEVKWRQPCYTFEGANIVIIQRFKSYFALGFFKGSLLKDPKGLLIKAGENTQAGRQMRFSDAAEVAKLKGVLKGFIREAIAAEKSGVNPEANAKHELKFPEEFEKKLKQNPALKAAFNALTPGRQRFYNIYFSGAKQSATREARIEKCIPLILKGKGLND